MTECPLNKKDRVCDEQSQVCYDNMMISQTVNNKVVASWSKTTARIKDPEVDGEVNEGPKLSTLKGQ